MSSKSRTERSWVFVVPILKDHRVIRKASHVFKRLCAVVERRREATVLLAL
jgi:hypothetical protein